MTKQYITNLESEEALCATLNKLIDDITNTNLLSNHEVQLEFGSDIEGGFTPFKQKGEIITSAEGYSIFDDSDAVFFQAACSFQESRDLVEFFMKMLINHYRNVGEFDVAYKHDEQVFGLIPSLALMQVDIRYIALYGGFLLTLDSNHFMEEEAGVFYAFEKYGCCLDTMHLLARALYPVCGQYTTDNLKYFNETFAIDSFLENPEHFEAVSNFMNSEFDQVHEGHKEFYSTLYHESLSDFKNGEESKFYQVLKNVESHYTFQQNLILHLINQGFKEFSTEKEILAGKKVFKLSKMDKKAIVLQEGSITVLPVKETFKSIAKQEFTIILLYCRLITSDFKLISPIGNLYFENCIQRLKKIKEDFRQASTTEIPRMQRVKLTRIIDAYEDITSKLVSTS